MQPVRRAIEREGALRWRLYDDVEAVGLLLEAFTLPAWAEFQRLRHRTTQENRKLEESLLPFLAEGRLLEARHFRSARHGAR